MKRIIDVSHPIRDADPCSFGTSDNRPSISYEEGESHGVFFITSRVDNLHSNTCTHIDFPGHLSGMAEKFGDSIGKYPVERFVGSVAVLDFSAKIDSIRPFFDDSGVLAIKPGDAETLSKFLHALDELRITGNELQQALTRCGASSALKGILFYTGLSSLWQYKKFESWQYLYFYNPYLSSDACEFILAQNYSFVGIDSFQLEHPIINFRGDELPVVTDRQGREFIAARLSDINMKFSNHLALLGNDILIYENLKLPTECRDRIVDFSGVPLNFQIAGLNDNGLTRPYISCMV